MSLKFSLPHFSVDFQALAKSSGVEGFSPASFEEKAQALSAKFESKSVGFFDWPELCRDSDLEQIEELSRKIRLEFDGAVIFGIGGSYLGPAAIVQALQAPEETKVFPITWISNADSRAIRNGEHFLKGRRCAAVITSKSGNTLETLSSFFDLSRQLPAEGYVAVTDPDSGLLRRLAKQQGWKTLSIPANIGGRFSVLTGVGLFPAALSGLDARALIAGARKMRRTLLSYSSSENPAYLFGTLKFLWDTKHAHNIQYLMPYHSGLSLFADWYVQLWAESLGKKGHGPTPVAALGTTDQHSLLQLWKEGPKDIIVGFMDVLGSNSNEKIRRPSFDLERDESIFNHTFDELNHLASLATEQSLKNESIPTYRIELASLNEEVLGALFFFFETACAFAGEWYGVNAFDQPGVEEAKRLLQKSL